MIVFPDRNTDIGRSLFSFNDIVCNGEQHYLHVKVKSTRTREKKKDLTLPRRVLAVLGAT